MHVYMKSMQRTMMLLMRPCVVRMMRWSMAALMGMLKQTDEHEYSCDEAYELLDRYAEIVAAGNDPRPLLPFVHRHLEMCGNCREEFETLLAAIQVVPQR